MALTRLPSFTLLSTDSFTFGNANISGNVVVGNIKTDHLLYANGTAYSLNSFTNDSGFATQTYVNTQITNLVASAPAALDTLNELANALGNDASYSTTITNALANKLSTTAFTSTADTWLGTKTTTNLTEGTNQYYTVARANTAIDARVTTSFVSALGANANIANVANSVAVANVTGIGNIATINKDGNASNILYGNGVFASAPVTYGDSNVAVYLPTYTGNLSPGNLAVSGLANLGAVANVKISGGTTGQYLKTDGTGNLSWATVSGGGGGASVTVSSTAPATPSSGDLWLDSESGELNVYFGGAWGSVSDSAPQLLSAVNSFTGDSVTTTYTLTTTPSAKEYTFVAIGGVLQPRSTYSLSGNVLTLSSAAPSNTPIEVTILGGLASPIGAATTVTSASQPNITSLGTLVSLTATGNITGNYFIGNGSQLTGVTAATATTATTAGTVTTAAQPNITSVGTLTSLAVTGNITSGNANLGNLVTANFHSGNGSLLSSIVGSNVTGQVGNALVSGTVYTNAQPNITSTGTLTSLTVSGLATFGLSAETFTSLTGATGTVAHDTTGTSTFYHTSPAANFTANFTNVSTTSNKIIVVVLVIAQGSTPYVPTVMQIDGTTQTVNWGGGSAPTGTASKYDVISYSLFRFASSWTVFGSASSFG